MNRLQNYAAGQKGEVEYLRTRHNRGWDSPSGLQDDQWNTYDESAAWSTFIHQRLYLPGSARDSVGMGADDMDDPETADRFHENLKRGQNKAHRSCDERGIFSKTSDCDSLNRPAKWARMYVEKLMDNGGA